LLIGDAAGLLFPITFEGIGTALKSGILAADSVARSVNEGGEAAGTYLHKLKSILQTISSLHACNKKLEQEATKGGAKLSEALKAAYEETLKVV
jgi:flavin-dependent dehydrogenase